jgi:hypothetical protein
VVRFFSSSDLIQVFGVNWFDDWFSSDNIALQRDEEKQKSARLEQSLYNLLGNMQGNSMYLFKEAEEHLPCVFLHYL